MLFRLAVVMVLFSVSRVQFWRANISFFGEITVDQLTEIGLGGIRFDWVSVIYLNLIYILIQIFPGKFKYKPSTIKFSNVFFVVTNSLGLLANCIDAAYFPFNLRRTTWQSLSELKELNNATALMQSFMLRYWQVGALGVIFILVLIGVVLVIKPKKQASFSTYTHFDLAFLFIFPLVAGLRGGDLKHSTRPLGLNHAGEYVNTPQQVYLVLNTPFSIFKTLGSQKASKLRFFSAGIEKVYSPIHHPTFAASDFKPFNVVIIIVESYSEEASGVVNSNRVSGGFTPFLDSLRRQSLFSKKSFANGKKSIEALPSVWCGLPSFSQPYVLSPFATNTVNSLPQILKTKGYHTSFFHGASNGSMGFQAFSNLIGIENYFGKNEFGDDTQSDGIWGIWDEPFLQFMARKINTFPQPFFSTVFTLSSHDPFKIPASYNGKLKKGPHPIYETLGYTDLALRRFFDKIKIEPWFNNTLFVFTADHTSSHASLPAFKSSVGRFRIPIFFYCPALIPPAESEEIIQQTDIFPTVLALLRSSQPYLAFGQVKGAATKESFAVNHFGHYQWLSGDYVLLFDGEKTVGLYNFVADSTLKTDVQHKLPALKQKMERAIKAYLQQYQNRLIDNRLTVK
jgi:Sulfatase